MRPPGKQEADETSDPRVGLCRSLGISSLLAAHRIIMAGARKGIQTLLEKGLTAPSLIRLGYDASGMEKLGYSQSDLKGLGYEAASESEERNASVRREGDAASAREQLDRMIAAGAKANELKQAGFTIHHCKMAGYDARELERMGFSLVELTREYGLHELKRVGIWGARTARPFQRRGAARGSLLGHRNANGRLHNP